MMTSPDAFFIFSKFRFSGLLVGVGKGQKMAQNDKKNLSHSVSQKLYLTWLWFLVHMCKMMISPAIFFFFFHFFKILIFWVFQSSSINVKRKLLGVPIFFKCKWLFFRYYKMVWRFCCFRNKKKRFRHLKRKKKNVPSFTIKRSLI